MTRTTDQPVPESGGVAVIIPAFNSAGHLDQALASVAGQTVLPEAVVIADDCSTDDTIDRARRWQGRLPLEVVRLRQNRGPGIARHHAIGASMAPLLAMLDADDLFLPDHIETMVATHDARPGLVSAQELSWHPGGGLAMPAQRVRTEPNTLAALLRRNFVNFGFFSRSLYEMVGGFRDQYCEDWDLWIRMVRTGASLTMASHPTAIHRVHAASRSFDAARTAQRSTMVLNAELRNARSPAEVAAVRAGLRALQGKLSFYRGMDLAARGSARQARRAALAGLPGEGPRAAAGLLALALAPSAAVWLEQRTRARRLPIGALALTTGFSRESSTQEPPKSLQ